RRRQVLPRDDPDRVQAAAGHLGTRRRGDAVGARGHGARRRAPVTRRWGRREQFERPGRGPAQARAHRAARPPGGRRLIPGARAYRESRPQRIPDQDCELAQLPSGLGGDQTFVLKNRRTEDYLLVTEQEKFLWEKMDGHASLQEIGTAYVLHYGAFDFDIIPT